MGVYIVEKRLPLVREPISQRNTATISAPTSSIKKRSATIKRKTLTGARSGVLNVERCTILARAKKLGLTGTLVPYRDAGKKTFFTKDQAQQIKDAYGVPEGYLTRQEVSERLGIKSRETLRQYIKADYRAANGIPYYSSASVDKLILQREEAALARERARILKQQQEQQQKKEAREKLIQDTIGGLLSGEQVASMVGFKLNTVLTYRLKGFIKSSAKHPVFNSHYFSPVEAQRFVDYINEERRKRREERDKNKARRYPKSSVPRGDNELYEEKLQKRLSRVMERIDEMSERRQRQYLRGIETNKQYARLRASGVIKNFICSTCDQEKPYLDFYFSESHKCGRDINKCKRCYREHNQRLKKNFGAKYEKARKENFRGKMRRIIGSTIKQDLSRHLGYYPNLISQDDIWDGLEKNCGYDLDGLISHIESQFDENMNWSNHGRGFDSYHWQIDHIKPRCAFVYEKFEDPSFIECWSLSNLRPLEWQENMVKGREEDGKMKTA